MILNAHAGNGMYSRIWRWDTGTGEMTVYDGITNEVTQVNIPIYTPENINGISANNMFATNYHVPSIVGWGFNAVSGKETRKEGIPGWIYHISGVLKTPRLIPLGFFRAIILREGIYNFTTAFAPAENWDGWFND